MRARCPTPLPSDMGEAHPPCPTPGQSPLKEGSCFGHPGFYHSLSGMTIFYPTSLQMPTPGSISCQPQPSGPPVNNTDKVATAPTSVAICVSPTSLVSLKHPKGRIHGRFSHHWLLGLPWFLTYSRHSINTYCIENVLYPLSYLIHLGGCKHAFVRSLNDQGGQRVL